MVRDSVWLLPFAVITLLGLLLSYWLAPLKTTPNLGPFAIIGMAVMAGLVLVRTAWILYQDRESAPLTRIAKLARENADRVLAVIAALYIAAVGGASFAATKAAIPAINPFYLDPYLFAIEGHLWKASHCVLGWATPAIDAIYGSWLPVQVVTFYALLMMRPSAIKAQAIVANALIWLVLGMVGAVLGSSVGPIYYDRVFGGSSFAELNETISAHAPIAYSTSEMLWRSYQGSHETFAGISAMPSLHVAIAFWIWLAVRGGPASKIAFGYFLLILIGSVHLGWHWLSDGIIAVVGALLMWKLAGRIIGGARTSANA